MMPTFALIAWPVVTLVLFAALGPQRGLIWSVVIGYLFLPENYGLNPPGLPRYGKTTAIGLGVLLGALFFKSRLPVDRSESNTSVAWLFRGLIALLIIGPLLTTLANQTPIFFGPTMRRGMSLWDVQSHLVPLFFTLAPWYLARRYLHTPQMHAELLRAMIVVGLFYTVLALYELRMSPQLNNILYGYFPHNWRQHIRGGGFRPLVFLDHGLSLGFYLLAVSISTVALLRIYAREQRAFFVLSAVWVFVVLSVSRNLGAFALGLLFVPFALTLSRGLQIKAAAIIVFAFLVNPLAREVYVQPLLSAAQLVSQQRHDSLKTRFDNEQAILDQFNKKPITGWGEWSRWRVHDARGRDITISDGTWIIVLSKWGWSGFIGFFGLLCAPVLLLTRAARRREISYATTGMALIIAANLIYLIPNSTLSQITWMMTGALAGFVQFIPARARDDEDPDLEPGGTPPRPGPAYTRFGPKAGDSAPLPVRRQVQSGVGARSPRALKK